MKESPWGHVWIEWNFHDKTATFENAAKLELQLASDLIRIALNAELQNTTRAFAAPMILSSPVPTQHIMKHQSVPLPDPWAKEVAKREILNHDSPSPQFCDQKAMSNTNSDDDSMASALQGVRLRSGTSSTFSGAVSQFGSTNGSLATNEGDIYGVSLENKPRYRHQHSQSFSAAVPLTTQPDLKGSVQVHRRGSISIPATTQNAKSSDGHNVNTLMLQHGIWSTAASDLISYATPSKSAFGSTEADHIGRGERSSRHTSNPSVSSQQRGLTVLSEDEEDVFSKGIPIKS